MILAVDNCHFTQYCNEMLNYNWHSFINRITADALHLILFFNLLQVFVLKFICDRQIAKLDHCWILC